MREYKPKSIKTLRKMVMDMREHCAHVSDSKYFGCHTCPYHIIYKDDSIGCYFEYTTGGEKPKDWNLNEMGGYI